MKFEVHTAVKVWILLFRVTKPCDLTVVIPRLGVSLSATRKI